MAARVEPKEAEEFFLNVPEKLKDPFPDLAYFREKRLVFFYPPFEQWFVFGYDEVAGLFHDPRLSADRMKGFVVDAPEEVREDLRKVASYLETFILFKDDPDHARMRKFLHRGFNIEAVRKLKGQIQEATDELLDRVQGSGHFDVCGDFGIPAPRVRTLRLPGRSQRRP